MHILAVCAAAVATGTAMCAVLIWSDNARDRFRPAQTPAHTIATRRLPWFWWWAWPLLLYGERRIRRWLPVAQGCGALLAAAGLPQIVTPAHLALAQCLIAVATAASAAGGWALLTLDVSPILGLIGCIGVALWGGIGADYLATAATRLAACPS